VRDRSDRPRSAGSIRQGCALKAMGGRKRPCSREEGACRSFLSAGAYSNRARHAAAAKRHRLFFAHPQNHRKSGAKMRHLSPKYEPKHAILRHFSKPISGNFSHLRSKRARSKKRPVKLWTCEARPHPLPLSGMWDGESVQLCKPIIVRKRGETSVAPLTNVPRGTLRRAASCSLPEHARSA
jgi:hypothetical protein